MSIHNRRFALAAAAALGMQHAAAQDKVEIKASTFVPPTHWFYSDILTQWAEEMQKRTGGQATVRLFAGNSPFGNVANQADQVAAGVTDVAIGLNGVPRGRLPRTLMMELPLVARTSAAGTRTLWSMRQSHLADDFKGFKLLGLNCSGGVGFFTREKKVERLDDLKGLRIRAPSSQIQAALQHLGAVPITMGPAQIYESLEKRTLDGVAMVYDGLVGFRLENLVKYYYPADMFVTCFHAVMNQRKYDSLPAGVKKAIDETTGDAWTEAFPAGWVKSEKATGAIAKGKGVVEAAVDPKLVQQWRVQLKPVIDQQLADTEKQGVSNARAIYEEMLRRADQYGK
jgi:TRAP-type transport system periplasmic protein